MKAEVYVGIYDLEDGMADIPKPSLLILWPYFGFDKEGRTRMDSRVHLVVQDGESPFWPCIVRMSLEEALELSEALLDLVQRVTEMMKKEKVEEQIITEIGKKGEKEN